MDTQLKRSSPEISTEALIEKINALPRPLVFTNGCFDILHRGHTSYLEQARNLGAALIVAVNSDDSVRRQNKGPDRPLNELEDRMSVLASLQCVDAVISFGQDTPLELITLIKPDHLVKGGDWLPDDIVGADVVRQYGGEVHSLAFQYARSTTKLVNKIRA